MRKTLLVAFLLLFAVAAIAGNGDVRRASRPIPGSYIVVLEDFITDLPGAASTLARIHGGNVRFVYGPALHGFAMELPAAANALAHDPYVKYIEEDGVMTIDTTQSGATWGIDRIDQRSLPLSGTFTYTANGTGVRAYVIDTGIRTTHTQFGGRASAVYDAFGGNGQDCNGHGTHVAGTIGGSTYGVAKNVMLRAVRVLDCNGSGSTSGVIAGVNWVTSNSIHPAVANMSLGGGASSSLDTAVANSINSGVTYAIAAGNSSTDACTSSPARVGAAITVGSTTSSDARSSFSNFGTCLDIFAPGSSITSAWATSDTATNTISGTSMATPHVTGVAALYISRFGDVGPANVRNGIVNNATTGVVSNAGSGSPNRLLFTNY
jgi:subtilisin family serine protease